MNPSFDRFGARAKAREVAVTITAEFICPGQSFRTTIRGVTKQNPDGTDRQALLQSLVPGQELRLVREPTNPYDRYAIAVLRTSGEQLGYVPAGDRRLADHMDMGGDVSAKVATVKGGPGILGIFFAAFRRPFGCVIEIHKGSLGGKEVLPYMHKSREIEVLIAAAHATEATDPIKAISMYRDAIEQIMALDALGSVAAAWRRARYPINRLSLLLDRNGQSRDAYNELLRYEQYNDVFGLTQGEEVSVATRKQRLSKKFLVTTLPGRSGKTE